MFYRLLQPLFLTSLILSVVISAWNIQSDLLLNLDVSWFLEAAKRLLGGGTYSKDFFENNPPWIIYFSILPVLLGKLFSIKTTLSMKLFVFTLSFISLGFSNYFLKNIFCGERLFFIRFLLIVVLATLFLIVPMRDFGQREHLLFILTMPYFLMMAQHLEGKPVPFFIAIIVGLLAGCVFLLKPYFLLSLFLVEVYCIAHRRNVLAFIRPEIVMIFMLLILYAALLFIRHLDYLHVVVPFAYRCGYLDRWKNALAFIFYQPRMVVCCVSILFYIILYEVNYYKPLTHILILALVGFLFSYVMQRSDYSYHILPAYCMALFVLFMFFLQYATLPSKSYISILVMLLIAYVLFALREVILEVSYCIASHPLRLLVFMAVLLGVILQLNSHRLIEKSGDCLFILVSSLLLGFALFIYPYYQLQITYQLFAETKSRYEKLISFLNNNAAYQSVYFFTTDIEQVFPILDYTQQTTSASRFSSFVWILPGLIESSYFLTSPMSRLQQMNAKNYLTDLVVEDLITKKPKYVFFDLLDKKHEIKFFVNAKESAALLKQYKMPYFPYIPFDYMDYFGTDQQFKDVMKKYHYIKTISQSCNFNINPWLFKQQLMYLTIPKDDEVELNTLYIYVRDKTVLELALRMNHAKVKRIQVDGLDKKVLSALTKMLSIPGEKLDSKAKRDLFLWLSKYTFDEDFYKFKIYERTD